MQDKIRDTLYGSAADERKSEGEAELVDKLTGANEMPFVIEKRLVVSLLVEAAGGAFIFFFPYAAGGYLSRFSEIVLIAWFGLGYVIGSSAYTVLRTEVLPGDDIPIDSGVMSGYSTYEGRQRQFKVYVAGAAGAVFNVLGLVMLLAALS